MSELDFELDENGNPLPAQPGSLPDALTPALPTPKPYSQRSLSERAADTFAAHFYKDGGLGAGIAAAQANPTAATEAAIVGLTPEEQALARQQTQDALLEDFRASKMAVAENPVRVTPAQIAQIRNDLWPEARTVGEYAADIGGALAGGMASPEMLVLPELRAAEALRAAAPFARGALTGIGERMVNTGAGMAVVSAAQNPVVQGKAVEAGLAPGFDWHEFAMAPATGFAGGALLHGGMELAGRGVAAVARGFEAQRVRGALDEIARTDPIFRAPGETPKSEPVAAPVEPEVYTPDVKAAAVERIKEQTGVDHAEAVNLVEEAAARPRSEPVAAETTPAGTETPATPPPAGEAPIAPSARLAEQPFHSMTASAPKIEADLGVKVPGTLLRGLATGDFTPEGIRAFHGSPHDFDRFELGKIGTGEGAQAYGHGLYFAENEGVAKSYRDSLSGAHKVPLENVAAPLKEVFPNIQDEGVAMVRAAALRGDPPEKIAVDLQARHPDFRDSGSLMEIGPKREALTRAVVEAQRLGSGRMYEVAIHADPERFLDWDKPLSEQSEIVQHAIREAGGGDLTGGRAITYGVARQQFYQPMEKILAGTPAQIVDAEQLFHGNKGWDVAAIHDSLPADRRDAFDALLKEYNTASTLRGSDAYHILARVGDDEIGGLTGSSRSADVSEALREAGIPGIKYLDGASRGAGEGSRNYVVFDHDLIHVVAKDGQRLAKPLPLNDFLKGEAAARHVEPLRATLGGAPLVTEAAAVPAKAATATTPAQPAKPGKPLSLVQFIARNGGLALDGDARALDLHKVFVPGGGPLARKTGRSIDGFWRERLMEAGYLPRDPDGTFSRDIKNELFDLIDAEVRHKQKTHAARDQGRIEDEASARIADENAQHEAEIERHAAEVRAALKEHDLGDADPATLNDAAELLWRGEHTDPLDAFERAVMMHAHADEGLRPKVEEHIELPPEWNDEVHGRAAHEDGPGGAGNGRRGTQSGSEERAAGPGGELPRASEGGFEPGAEGKPQAIIPGAERISQAEQAQRLADKALAPKAPQKDTDGLGLFGDSHKQGDLRFREKQPGAQPAQPGSSGTDTGRADKVASLQQQSVAIADDIGIPLRQGRVRNSKAAGQYSTKYGVARVREIGDFYTVAHEGGHALEQRLGLTDLIDKHASELASLDYDRIRGDPGEGFAEWFALSLTNPAAAERAAPTFQAAYRGFMAGAHPDLLGKLDGAAARYAAYLNAPSGERIAAGVVSASRHGFEHVTHALETLRKEGLPATIGMVMAKVYTAVFDRYNPVDRAARVLARAIQAEQGGGLVSINPSEDPTKLIRLFDNHKNGALDMLKNGVVVYGDVQRAGPGLMDAIAHASGQNKTLALWKGQAVEDFSTYLVARRAAGLWDRFNDGRLENPPVSFSKQDAVRAMAEYEAANPTFAEASDLVHRFTRDMLTRQRDAGIITQDLFEKLSEDPFYVPLFRDVTDKPLTKGGAGGSSSDGPGMTETVRKIRGSSRDIIDPIQGLMMQTLLAERTIRHNDIIRGFVGLADRAGYRGDGVVEPVAAKELKGIPVDAVQAIRDAARKRGMDPADTELLANSIMNAFGDDPIMGTMFRMQPGSKRGEPIIFYKEAGDLRAVRLSSDSDGLALYEALSTLPRVATDMWLQTANLFHRGLRAGVVMHPTFALANYIKDQVAVGILRNDYIPIMSGLKGLWSEITQDDAARLYAFFGGMSPGAAASGTGIAEPAATSIKDLAKRDYATARLTSLHGLTELPQITESATRNSIFAKVYTQKLNEGLRPVDAAVEAAYQATDILDFGRHGSHTLAARAFVPFLNPHLQGIDKAIRTMLVPLGKMVRGDIVTVDDKAALNNAGWALGKFLALSPVLGAMWAALNWDREEYRDATPEQKAMNVILPWGNGKAIRAPKPFELGLGFTAGEYAFARFVGGDPRAASQFVEAAWEVLKTPNLIVGNPLVTTYVENATNKKLFSGRDVVPPAYQNLDPRDQFNERTSAIAKGVGSFSAVLSDWLNQHTNEGVAKSAGLEKAWSPMKVDNAIGNLWGYMGKQMQDASNLVASDTDKPESRFEDSAFAKRFTLDPARWSETVKRYYEFAAQRTGEYAQAAETFQKRISGGNLESARQWLAQLSADKKAYAIMAAGGDEEGKAAFKPAERQLHPITRAQAALSELHNLVADLVTNKQTNSETHEPIVLTQAQRRDAIDQIHNLGLREMRNALVITGDQGYDGRAIKSVKDQFEVLKAVSPDVAEEVARRYAMKKVLPTEAVAKAWPQARALVLRDGTAADISGIADEAASTGWEFGAERTVKRRLRTRKPIPGQATAP